MEEININYIPIYLLGYVKCNVPSDIMVTTRTEVKKMITSNFKKNLPFNKFLAGAIQHEYVIPSIAPVLNIFFEKVIPEYWRLQGNTSESKTNYKIRNNSDTKNLDIWINLQKKYELNPIHNHAGVLSFVYWVKIPYDIEEEKKLPCFGGNSVKNPVFSFLHTSNGVIEEHSLNVDKSYENQMIIFPANLKHMVTPFYTSDDYRISVAGNLVPDSYD